MSDHVDELLALHALGGLEPDEASRVEQHLVECAPCRAEADAMRAVVGLIAQAAPAQQPRGEVRTRLMQRLWAKAPEGAPRPVGRRTAWAFAALSAALILALFGWNFYLNTQLNSLRRQLNRQEQYMSVLLSTNRREIVLAAQNQDPGNRARAYLDPNTRAMVVIIDHLPPLGPDKTYQLWLITDAGPQPSILLGVNEQGWGMTSMKVPEAQANFDAIGVSVEPAGGSQTPTEVVLLGEA
jgi:anti-sigma-K factor RskA